MDWIKIMCNILDHRKIKMIRKGPEGNTIVLLWLLMLTEAGKCNRGGYLMISDMLPYTAETLSMVTDIPLTIVDLGLATLTSLAMIDQQDNAIYIRNWAKYQSQDKLQARLDNDRIRQLRHRQTQRAKLLALPSPQLLSRDCHVSMSRDITLENREDKSRKEKTTDEIRMLFSGTPLSKITPKEMHGLAKRHGFERLAQAADIAAETWRRSSREEMHNPGGYLQTLCSSLVVPDWYLPLEKRKELSEAARRREAAVEAEKAKQAAQEEEHIVAMTAGWESLTDDQREGYIKKALASAPKDIKPPPVAILAIAKQMAWNESLSHIPAVVD